MVDPSSAGPHRFYGGPTATTTASHDTTTIDDVLQAALSRPHGADDYLSFTIFAAVPTTKSRSLPPERPSSTPGSAHALPEPSAGHDGAAAPRPLVDPALTPNWVLALRSRLAAHILSLTHGHLWTADPLTLDDAIPVADDADAAVLPVATGTAHVGECADDAWLMTAVLADFTKVDPTVAMTLAAADGDPLLIEAATYLPSWVTPETAPHRAWLAKGTTHLVPPSVRVVSAAEGAAAVLLSQTDTVAPNAMRAHLDAHLARYLASAPHANDAPGTVPHVTRVVVPRRVAHVLSVTPQLASVAIAAAAARDPVGMRLARGMPVFGPDAPDDSDDSDAPENQMVRTTVRLTRVLYAQLVAIKVDPVPARLAAHAATWDKREFALGVALALGCELAVRDPMVAGGVWRYDESGLTVREVVDAALAAVPQGEVGSGEPDDDGWMVVTEADVKRWVQRDDAASKFAVDQVIKSLDAVAGGTSGVDGIGADETEPETDSDDDSDDDDGAPLFDGSRFFDLLHGRAKRAPVETDSDSDSDSDEDEDPFAPDSADPVDEAQALKDLLESVKAQEGMAGPVTTLLAQMGMWVPGDAGPEQEDSEKEGHK
ncbi:hypothetical protein AMAG_14608 [Allomyces macrogynus ATCC 38327]|uniref:SGT1 protein n=1 Tax=Allomyces macrogynus (strain ATCC 38327) TaxID=578462 RepID=A0A0L0T6T8_ALLM3|nr:hypothetical protein AMAG_14608 [Allomyces macrogynus ATCC 38327]|eukprot:KNE70483.1 hypothetical protein AMAG_14608 [Allomyces macrogynus ATCC 38327]